VVGALFAVAWLAGLLYSAQLFAPRTPLDPADRIRYTLVLCCAEPLGLAVFHLLYPATLLIVTLALCVACRFSARRSFDPSAVRRPEIVLALTVLAAASPSIVRPPLEGDSLLYHLPNAIAWVQSGSLDPTWMRYWWYPGGSELVVAGFICAGGMWIAGVPSLLAATMLVLRLQVWLRELSVGSAAAASIATAFLTMPAAVFQTYDARNDLVSAAWFVESLWMLRREPARAFIALAMLSIVKPNGWLLALVAILCAGRPRDLVALVPVGLWAVHDALLDRHAVDTIAWLYHPWPTTIAANVPLSLAVLAHSLLDQGPVTATLFTAALLGLLGKDDRRIALSGLVSMIMFAFTPFSFATYLPTLATGASLRFALPGLAVGAITLAPIARRFPLALTIVGILSTIFGLAHVFQVFANDRFTIVSWVAVVIIAALATIPNPALRAATVSVSMFALFLGGAYLARSRASSFYADEMPSVQGRPTAFFEWFTQHAHAAEAVDIRAGELLVLAPGTHIADAAEIDCEAAGRDGAWIIVGVDRDVPPALRKARFDAARKCGPTLFSDDAFIVSNPK
jgi:hypothetical protein